MKKALIALAGLVLVAWVISWFRVPEDVARSASRPWPGELGPLESAAQRVPPPGQANGAAVKLTSLAGALPKNQAVDDFVAREITRGELTIGEPPSIPDLSAK